MVTVVARTVAALRKRVSMSEIGSVIIGLPACFSDTWKLTNVGEFTEADTAQTERTHEETLTSTAPATMYAAGHELRSLLRFRDLIRGCHSLFLSFGDEGEPETFKQCESFFMILSGGRNRNLETVK